MNNCIINKIAVKLAILIVINIIYSQQYQYLPYQRSENDFRYLNALSILSDLDISEQPIEKNTIIKYINKIPESLRKHYNIKENNYRIKIGAYTITKIKKKYAFQLRSLLEIKYGNKIKLSNMMLLDKSLINNNNYIGYNWRRLVGYTEQGFVAYKTKFNKLNCKTIFGRSFDYWGTGRTGKLIISSAARPLDQLKINFNFRGLSFTIKTSKLDNIGNKERYISAHRISYKNQIFQFAINESIIYGGENRTWELALINPFILYHGVQLNDPWQSGNTMGSIDGRIFFSRFSPYFEILVDDIQFDAKNKADLEPNEIGLILGSDIALEKIYLGIEFVAITNRTYKTSLDYEWYTHRNVPIGYSEGSDLWRANIFSRYYFSQNWQFDFELDYLVKGEGELSKPWDEPWMNDDITMESGYSEPFPTGILEKKFTSTLGVFRMFDYNKWVSLELNYFTIKNKDHILNVGKKEFEISFGFSWLFTKEFDL